MHTHSHALPHSPLQLTVEGKPGSLYLSFSSGCPHAVLREHLEAFLNSSRSLPLLLQGLVATEKTMEVLSNFVSSLPNTDSVSVSTISPPQVQLKYNNLYPLLLSIFSLSFLATFTYTCTCTLHVWLCRYVCHMWHDLCITTYAHTHARISYNVYILSCFDSPAVFIQCSELL